MNVFDIIADLVGLIGKPTADHDRSAVGESPMDRRAAMIWRWLVILLVVAISAVALYHWVAQQRAASPRQHRPDAPSSSTASPTP